MSIYLLVTEDLVGPAAASLAGRVPQLSEVGELEALRESVEAKGKTPSRAEAARADYTQHQTPSLFSSLFIKKQQN